MIDQPLQPFAPPAFFEYGSHGSTFGGNWISTGTLIELCLYIVFAFWAVYTLIAIYHWLKYSHASLVAIPAIGVHLFVSFALMAYALSGAFIL